MFWRILKRDLKRKVATNVIVFLFIILATTFVSGSMNSILAISKGTDFFLEKAGIPDYCIETMDAQDIAADEEKLRAVEGVTYVRAVPMLFVDGSDWHKVGEKRKSNVAVGIVAVDNSDVIFFDAKGNALTEVEPGTIYVTGKDIKEDGFQIGDAVEIDFDGMTKTFRIEGIVLDASFGSSSVTVSRIVMNSEEFREIYDNRKEIASTSCGAVFCIETDDVSKIEQGVELSGTRMFSLTKSTFSTIYLLDMAIAAAFLIVSVCLIFLSCIILKFIISTTVSEEFREIGAMKAVGIGNTRIRILYAVKYFSMASTGAFVGFFLGIPFGNAVISSASKTLLLDNGNAVPVGIASSVFVVVLVTLFCFIYTRKIKRLSPVNAVSDIGAESRIASKRRLHLKNHRGRSGCFMAANDIVTHPRKYVTVALTYSVCLLLVMILTVLDCSVCSKSFVRYLGIHECHIQITLDQDALREHGILTDAMDVSDILEARLDYVDATLSACGFSGKAIDEVSFNPNLTYGDYSAYSLAFIGVHTHADEYFYTSGTAPARPNEIAVTNVIAEKLHATIGDTVRIDSPAVSGEFIISALYQTTTNLGEGVRLYENADFDFDGLVGCVLLVCFDDAPDDDEIARRAEKMKGVLYAEDVKTYKDYMNELGGIMDMISVIKNAILLISCAVIALITVLMERTFAMGERSEIALVKAVGFPSGKVYFHHTMRFVFIGLFSVLLAAALAIPVTKLALNPIFAMFGATEGIVYVFDPVQLLVFCPFGILGVMAVSAFLTSLLTKSVKARDAASIE